MTPTLDAWMQPPAAPPEQDPTPAPAPPEQEDHSKRVYIMPADYSGILHVRRQDVPAGEEILEFPCMACGGTIYYTANAKIHELICFNLTMRHGGKPPGVACFNRVTPAPSKYMV